MKLEFSIGTRTFSLGAQKSVSPAMAAFARGDDVMDGGGASLVHPYAQSAWVYIAASRLAEKVSSIPFRISRLDEAGARRVRAFRGSSDPRQRGHCRRALGENIVEHGDVVDLFNRPHPTMNRQLFWEMVVTWNCLRGEFFIVPLDSADQPVDLATRAPRIDRLLTLPTELFWQVVSGYDLTAWRYTGTPLLTPLPSEILLPSEVIHGRTPNPYLYWRGMSPLFVALVAAGSDFAAAKYAQGYWLNNADTGVIVTTESLPDEAQRKAIEAALRERKRKAGTADRPLFLWGGAKVEKPTLSGMETQFIENRRMNRQEIGAIFKVPESVMGFSADKSSALSGGGAAIDAEQLQFVESAVAPLCAHLEASIEPIVTSFGPGLVGWFDLESLPVMQATRRARLDTAIKAFNIGVPLNDANQVYDLGFPEYEWGNKSFLPFNLQEIGATAPELPGEELPADAAKSNPFARMAALLAGARAVVPEAKAPATHILWQSHIATRRKTVKQFAAKVGKVLAQFRAVALAKLAEIHFDKSIEQRSLISLIFSSTDFGARLYSELTHPIVATLQLAGNELNQEIGIDDPWQMPPKKAQDYLASRKQSVQECGETVRNQLNTALQAGLDGGETTAELAGRVREVFTSLADHEATRIAQTEVNMAYNDARHEAMGDAGIEYKAWLSSHGPNVREGHAAAEEEYIKHPIPLDEPFEVENADGKTERLLYPGDGSLGASAGNIINCQCIQLAARAAGETATADLFNVCGLGELSFPKP